MEKITTYTFTYTNTQSHNDWEWDKGKLSEKLVRIITFQREYRSSRDRATTRNRMRMSQRNGKSSKRRYDESTWMKHAKEKPTQKKYDANCIDEDAEEMKSKPANMLIAKHFVLKSRSNGRNSYRLWKSNGRHHLSSPHNSDCGIHSHQMQNKST